MGPEWPFLICDRMRHSMLVKELERRGLAEASHPVLLFILSDAGKGASLSQREIARRLGVSSPTAAVSIRRMARGGLLRKAADEKDLRRNCITLTPMGRKLVGECKAAFDEIDRRMFEGFSDEERGTLRSYFLRMIRNLEAMGAQCPADFKEGEKK
jgi:DNA-binding MarR family transcriptional regulator